MKTSRRNWLIGAIAGLALSTGADKLIPKPRIDVFSMGMPSGQIYYAELMPMPFELEIISTPVHAKARKLSSDYGVTREPDGSVILFHKPRVQRVDFSPIATELILG